MTWLQPPFFGPEVSPLALVANGTLGLSRGASWQAWVFLGGFAAAGLAAVLALSGRRGAGRDPGVGPVVGSLALAAGLSPLAALGRAVLGAEELRQDFGLPFAVNLGDLAQAWNLLQDFIRAGVWIYGGGAALLLMAGLVALGSRARRR